MKNKSGNQLLTSITTTNKNLLTLFLFALLFACSFSVSAQSAPPATITCPADIVQNNDPGLCSASVTFPDATNGDPNLTVTYSHPSGAPYPIGTTKVEMQLLDQNGVPVSSCSFNVTVVDTEAPVFSNCPGDISVKNTKDACGAVVTYAPPTITDACTRQQRTFDYTGAPVTFVVPVGVTQIDVDVKGAAGGHTYYNGSVYGTPGLGGETGATIKVTPGQVLTINVGGAGQDASVNTAGTGGYNGGGNGTGLTENGVVFTAGGGGGGASDIRTAGGTLADRILVAGGGGGASTLNAGGDGGDVTGANGSGGAVAATGGTQTQGGTGGSGDNTSFGGNGLLGTGGAADAESVGGGGGAGLYGGGGGSIGSGAGGSSYAYSGATDVYHIQGAQEGNGSVKFSYNQPATLVQTAGLPSGATFPVDTTINTFTATDAAGNTSTCTFKVIVTDAQNPTITAPANVSVVADNNSCAATNVALGTAVTADNCGVAKVSNNAPKSFSVGTTTVNYTVTDIHGNTAVATQTVTVTDNQKPVLSVPAAQTFSTAAASYTIPALSATDNCGVGTITYSISGATTRTGTGADASGSFNAGTSVITYTVNDIHGNTQTGTTTVTVTAVQQPTLNVTIADVYAVSPGGKPNTIYIGYGPSYLTLKATVTGGKSPYTYEWKYNGYPIIISGYQSLDAFLPGEYTVTVTDAKGARGTFTKQVLVVDVTCTTDDKKDDKDPKVIVCKATKGDKKTESSCMKKDDAAKELMKGGTLGNCTQTTTSLAAGRTSLVKSDEVAAEFITPKFVVFPNPTSGLFTVQLNNLKAPKAEINILSQNGMSVQKKTVELTGAFQKVQFNISNLTSGVYLVKVVSDEGIQIQKVILQH